MRWWPKSEHTAYLEAEVARLQRENRELVNSILATAGLPGLTTEAKEAVPPIIRGRVRLRDIARAGVKRTREALKLVEPVYREAAEKKANVE